jgi:RNA polymerase sigma factor (sigma-70 family)
MQVENKFLPGKLDVLKSDEELIQGCLRDHAASQLELYNRYCNKMYAVCLRYARNKSDAPDILQDGFVKVYSYLKQYKGNGSFEGWMRRIMVNTALRMYQKQRYLFEHNGYEVLPEHGVDASIIDILSAEELMRKIDTLPEGYRIIFNLVAIDGLSHQEVAAELGIQESTSRSQLTKARRYLIKALENQADSSKLKISTDERV